MHEYNKITLICLFKFFLGCYINTSTKLYSIKFIFQKLRFAFITTWSEMYTRVIYFPFEERPDLYHFFILFSKSFESAVKLPRVISGISHYIINYHCRPYNQLNISIIYYF